MSKEELCARYEMALRAIITLGHAGTTAIARTALILPDVYK